MFRYTPLGWLLLIAGSLALVAMVRSTLVATYQPTQEASTNRSEWLALILFVGLLLGIVKWSWFGMFPYLADLLGTPLDLVSRVQTAVILGLFVGTIAYFALHLADSLLALAKIPQRRFARTGSIPPTKHRSSS